MKGWTQWSGWWLKWMCLSGMLGCLLSIFGCSSSSSPFVVGRGLSYIDSTLLVQSTSGHTTTWPLSYQNISTSLEVLLHIISPLGTKPGPASKLCWNLPPVFLHCDMALPSSTWNNKSLGRLKGYVATSWILSRQGQGKEHGWWTYLLTYLRLTHQYRYLRV